MQNFVAKHAGVNRAVTMIDRKKEQKKGSTRKQKHKGSEW